MHTDLSGQVSLVEPSSACLVFLIIGTLLGVIHGLDLYFNPRPADTPIAQPEQAAESYLKSP